MLGFYGWLLMMLIMAIVFFVAMWLVVRSAVQSGMRAARQGELRQDAREPLSQ